MDPRALVWLGIEYGCNGAFFGAIREIPFDWAAWECMVNHAASHGRGAYLMAILVRHPVLQMTIHPLLCRRVEDVLIYSSCMQTCDTEERLAYALCYACAHEHAWLIRDLIGLGASADYVLPAQTTILVKCIYSNKIDAFLTIASCTEIGLSAEVAAHIFWALLRGRRFRAARAFARVFHVPLDAVAAAYLGEDGPGASLLAVYAWFERAGAAEAAELRAAWWFPLLSADLRRLAAMKNDEGVATKLSSSHVGGYAVLRPRLLARDHRADAAPRRPDDVPHDLSPAPVPAVV